MSRNRKSFIYVTKIDMENKKISFRVMRIKKNRPVLLGNPEMKTGILCLGMNGQAKKSLMKITVREFLKKVKQVLPGHIPGVDYLLEAV